MISFDKMDEWGRISWHKHETGFGMGTFLINYSVLTANFMLNKEVIIVIAHESQLYNNILFNM